MTDSDRLPPIPPGQRTTAQREAAEEIEAGPRGAVVGPFIAALRSPEFMRRLQRLGEYLRFDNSLGPKLTELTVLIVARHFTSQFEWVMHAPLAAERGIGADAIEAISAGRRPESLSEDEAIVHDFAVELLRSQTVPDGIYERAVAVVGEAGVVDLVGTVGYYSTLAMILNVAGTPLPPDKAPVLRPLAET